MDPATSGQSTSRPKSPPPPAFRFYDIYSSSLCPDPMNDDDSDRVLKESARTDSLDVYADLIIVFKYKQPAKGVSKQEYEQATVEAYKELLAKLTRVGLQYETRPNGIDTLYIFILCPWLVLKREATRTSIQDWLAGVRVADTSETEQLLQPAKTRDQSLDSLSDSDRIRLVHDLITGLYNEGGAGIHPEQDEYVESILPLHDKSFNKAWLKSWSKKWILDQKDLSRVRDHFGEKVAYYFEFLQFYFQWLAIPTALGVLVHFLGSPFSIFYGVCLVLWSVVFTESWKRREKELSLWWGVRHVSKTETRRPEFKGDTMTQDPVTGEMTPFFSPWKRWSRKVAGIPVVLGGACTLAGVITAVFAIEVFLTMYYDGPFKGYLIYFPTVLYSLAIPNVAALCKSVSKSLTDYENYETHGSHEYHLMQKVFIFNALTSYMSILLTAYIYIPFGPQVISTFQNYGLSFSSATVESSMLQSRLKAFMVTTQAVSLVTETIVPWATRRALGKATGAQKKNVIATVWNQKDSDEAKRFLKRVEKQADLPVYDVNEDYAEMVLQFGYVSLFSVIWPLTGLCAFVNNWVELRSDAVKISFNSRRPIPSRTDSIGPWVDNIQHITWFASLTNASILYLFHGTHDEPRLSFSMLLLALLVSEHAYLGVRSLVGMMLDTVPLDAELNVRKKEFGVKSSWLSRLGDAVGAGVTSVSGYAVSGFTTAKSFVADTVSMMMGSPGAVEQFENDVGVRAIRSCLKTN
ncbi:hypothetical protein BGX34_009478 [Mortierella sp. NVP85]|nr:hypothetical protein BGX34_009478 [Mortierella sp. NVP85]